MGKNKMAKIEKQNNRRKLQGESAIKPRKLLKNNRSSKAGRAGHSFKLRKGIAAKLIAAFLIPVAFVIIIGIASYMNSSTSIISNYKKASLQSMKMTGEYMAFGLASVESKGVQYITDPDIKRYFNGISNQAEAVRARTNTNAKLLAEQVSDDLIENIHILSNKVETMTTAEISEKDMYTPFVETEAGKKLKDGYGVKYWIGSEDYLDETLGLDKEDYALRYVCSLIDSKACVIFDISTEALRNILSNLDFGNNSITGFVTGDGRELITASDGNKAEKIFGNEAFYQQAIQSNETDVSANVTYQGKDYLFISSRVGDTGAMVCALIPEVNILKQVNGIKNLTIILVVLSCIIAILIGFMMASGIQRVIRYIIAELEKVSQGNLTIKLKVKNKDEFHILADGINRTIDNMRSLIDKVKQQSSSVMASSGSVTSSSEVIFTATQGISESMNEIQSGITQQAQDAENCLQQMDKLSEKIQLVSGKTDEISNIAADTKDSVATGIDSMSVLNTKSRETYQITERVIQNIEVLDSKSKSIGRIIETINEIANQTNLLSLNASIEAARAGEAGKGFTVVAEEIRKLADQSMQAVREIGELIKEIQVQTKNTVMIANEADSVVSEQEAAVINTEKSLRNLSTKVEKLIGNVDMITDSILNIDTARAGTLSAIENISAVSQQTAAATMSVNEITQEQKKATLSLNELSKELDVNAQALEAAVQQFVLKV